MGIGRTAAEIRERISRDADTGAAGHRPLETYSPGYSGRVLAGHAARSAEREAAFFLPRLRPRLRLLDAGCGPGTITAGLAAAVAPGEVVGIDAAPHVLVRARDHTAARGAANVAFRRADVYALPFPDASFDAAFAHALLEHLAGPVAALRELRRVLRPGGVSGAADVDVEHVPTWPADSLLEQAEALIRRWWRHNGGGPAVGRRRKALLREAGFERIASSARATFLSAPEAAAQAGEFLAGRWTGGRSRRRWLPSAGPTAPGLRPWERRRARGARTPTP